MPAVGRDVDRHLEAGSRVRVADQDGLKPPPRHGEVDVEDLRRSEEVGTAPWCGGRGALHSKLDLRNGAAAEARRHRRWAPPGVFWRGGPAAGAAGRTGGLERGRRPHRLPLPAPPAAE